MDLPYQPNDKLIAGLLGMRTVKLSFTLGTERMQLTHVDVLVQDMRTLDDDQVEAVAQWAAERLGIERIKVSVS